MDQIENDSAAGVARTPPHLAAVTAESSYPRTPAPGENHRSSGFDSVAIDALVDGAVAGNRSDLGELLRLVHPLVVRYCRARLTAGHRSISTADDVAQEVCMAVINALPAYRRDGRPFLALVYGIAAHKVVDAHRAGGRSRSIPVADVPEGPAMDPGPEHHVMSRSVATSMDQLLSRLPAAQQEILRLRVTVGLSADETAEAMGMTAVAVRVSQHRALAKLRTMVENDSTLSEQLL